MHGLQREYGGELLLISFQTKHSLNINMNERKYEKFIFIFI